MKRGQSARVRGRARLQKPPRGVWYNARAWGPMGKAKTMRKLKWMWLALFAWLLLTGAPGIAPVAAQDAPNSETITPDQVNDVARTLYCPLCSGVRLDACELKACDQMKDMIALKLAEGEDTETIRDYFVAQYGPQVLGEPPREGFNWLAWILPFVALAAGGVYLWQRTRRMVQSPESVPVGVAPGDGMQDDRMQDDAIQNDAVRDEYGAKLDEELTKYG